MASVAWLRDKHLAASIRGPDLGRARISNLTGEGDASYGAKSGEFGFFQGPGFGGLGSQGEGGGTCELAGKGDAALDAEVIAPQINVLQGTMRPDELEQRGGADVPQHVAVEVERVQQVRLENLGEANTTVHPQPPLSERDCVLRSAGNDRMLKFFRTSALGVGPRVPAKGRDEVCDVLPAQCVAASLPRNRTVFEPVEHVVSIRSPDHGI